MSEVLIPGSGKAVLPPTIETSNIYSPNRAEDTPVVIFQPLSQLLLAANLIAKGRLTSEPMDGLLEAEAVFASEIEALSSTRPEDSYERYTILGDLYQQYISMELGYQRKSEEWQQIQIAKTTIQMALHPDIALTKINSEIEDRQKRQKEKKIIVRTEEGDISLDQVFPPVNQLLNAAKKTANPDQIRELDNATLLSARADLVREVQGRAKFGWTNYCRDRIAQLMKHASDLEAKKEKVVLTKKHGLIDVLLAFYNALNPEIAIDIINEELRRRKGPPR